MSIISDGEPDTSGWLLVTVSLPVVNRLKICCRIAALFAHSASWKQDIRHIIRKHSLTKFVYIILVKDYLEYILALEQNIICSRKKKVNVYEFHGFLPAQCTS